MKLIFWGIVLIAFLWASPLYAAETTIVFEGQYEYRTDVESIEILGKQVCFFPSTPSSQKVPRPAGDLRLRWFCFTNSEQAAHLFGFALNAGSNGCGFKGSANITVSNYKRYTGEGGGNDVATLDAVLKKSKPTVLPCSK